MKLVAKDVSGNNHEIDSHELIWRVHVYGVVINDGKILLSPQHGDAYDLPGGKVALDETMETGLIREVKEETGIDVTVGELLGVKDIFFKVTFREPYEAWHSVMVYYACGMVGGDISTEGFDEYEKGYAQAAEWVSLDKLDSLTRASSVDYIPYVKKALEQQIASM